MTRLLEAIRALYVVEWVRKLFRDDWVSLDVFQRRVLGPDVVGHVGHRFRDGIPSRRYYARHCRGVANACAPGTCLSGPSSVSTSLFDVGHLKAAA